MFCFGTEIGNCQFDGHIEFMHDADCVTEVDRTRERRHLINVKTQHS